MTEVRHSLRATFDVDAERYDRCRPGYPAALFDDLRELVPIETGTRVLEIGCGTGQATVPLARLGAAITAVELGAELAAIARGKLADFDARVVVGAFEDWPLPATPFDLVLAATSFHWLDPTIRVIKSANALRPGGAIAVVSTHHIAGGTAEFFAGAQRCYERFDPDTRVGQRLPNAHEVPFDRAEFDASGRFTAVALRRYEWETRYTAREYVDLLRTYSGTIAMPAGSREALLSCIGRLIDREYVGTITKRYLTQLAIARRAR
ncbi:MAG: methyltransferase domain-containing protein [Sciscionella sp.]|nr:methyltransferase domain-containing protein [Sciscionella sp.]